MPPALGMRRKECSAALLGLLVGPLVWATAMDPASIEAGTSAQAPQLALDRYLAGAKPSEGWSATAIDIEASIDNRTKFGRLRAIRRVLPLGGAEHQVLEMEGDRTVRQVILRYLSAGKEGGRTHEAGIALTPANYRFRYRRPARAEGRLAWVFEIVPRKKRTGLIRGELWIDAASGLVLRQAGHLVRTPSISLRRVNVTRDTEILDGALCARVTRLEMDARLLGRAELTITDRPFTPVAGVQIGSGGAEAETQRRVEAR